MMHLLTLTFYGAWSWEGCQLRPKATSHGTWDISELLAGSADSCRLPSWRWVNTRFLCNPRVAWRPPRNPIEVHLATHVFSCSFSCEEGGEEILQMPNFPAFLSVSFSTEPRSILDPPAPNGLCRPLESGCLFDAHQEPSRFTPSPRRKWRECEI